MKLRSQTALASLSPEERQSLANLLYDGQLSYEQIRQQVNLPRDQGGYGLKISIKPLQVLHRREAERRLFNQDSPRPIDLDQFSSILNGDPQPHNAIGLHFLQQKACQRLLAADTDTPSSELLALSRILNLPHLQQIAREKLSLQRERLAISQRLAAVREAQLDLQRQTLKARDGYYDCSDDYSDHPEPPAAAENANTPPRVDPELEAFIRYAHPDAIAARMASQTGSAPADLATASEELDAAPDPAPCITPAPVAAVAVPAEPAVIPPGCSAPLETLRAFAPAHVFPFGIDPSIDPDNERTWPEFYFHLRRQRKFPILIHLAFDKVRIITPCSPHPPECGMLQVLFRHFGNPEYLAALDRLGIPYTKIDPHTGLEIPMETTYCPPPSTLIYYSSDLITRERLERDIIKRRFS
jgi:hypothetical protein